MYREYIIDGYNLLHKLFPKKTPLSLELKREQMESKLLGFQHSTGNKVTVVYDGQHPYAPASDHGALARYFTASNRSADDWIIDCLRASGKNAQRYTVVSSDRFICRHAMAYGASSLLSEQFISRFLTKNHRAEKKRSDQKKFGNEELGQKELDQWLALFGKANRQSK